MSGPTEVTQQAVEDAVRVMSQRIKGDPLEARLRSIADLYRRRASTVADIVSGNDHGSGTRRIDGIWFDRWGIVVGVTVGQTNWVNGEVVTTTPLGRIYDCTHSNARALDLLAQWAEWSRANYLYTRRVYKHAPAVPVRDEDGTPGSLPDEIARLVEFAKRDAEAVLEQRGEL